jgi:hypothetical protein
MKARIEDRGALLQLLTEYFSEEDLKTLCFELDIDYDALEGGSKTSKARELVAYCENRDRLADLATALRKARPTLQVPIALEATETAAVVASAPSPLTATERPRGNSATKVALFGIAGTAIAALALFVVLSLPPDAGEPNPTAMPQPSAELPAAATDAATPEAESTPEQAPTAATVVEGFESWTNPLPTNMFFVDQDAGNDGQLSVTDDPAHVAKGGRALEFTYTIANADPDPTKNYAGFEHVLSPAQDWSAYSQFCATVEADAATPVITFQFGSGYPEADYSIVDLQPGRHDYCVPVRRETNYANLSAITSYWFYIDGTSGQRQATIYIDDIRLVP